MPRRPHILILEHNNCHDELFATWVHVLRRLGCRITIGCRWEVLRRRPLAYAADDSFSWVWYRKNLTKDRPLPLHRFDAVLLNSLEDYNPKPEQPLTSYLHDIKQPILAIVHDPRVLGDDEAAFFDGQQRQLAALFATPKAAHILHPVYLGRTPKPVLSAPPRFALQGNIQFFRRNYQSWLRALETNTTDAASFRLIGNDQTADGAILKKRVPPCAAVDWQGKVPSYRRYYRLLSECAFLLPLIDDVDSNCARYFHAGVSSSASLALGLGIVPVLNEAYAAHIQQTDGAVLYHGDDVAAGIKAALALTPAAYRAKQDWQHAAQRRLLDKTEAAFAQWLSSVGLRP
jgi:hypothetical protein